MKHFLFLAFAYARFHRVRTLTLVAAVAIASALPAVVGAGVRAFERALSARAQTTPLIVGAPGGRFDLVLATLYYRQGKVAPLPYGVYQAVSQNPEGADAGGIGAQVFPVSAMHGAGGHPLVGTTLEYLDYRRLRPASGRLPGILGDVALGAQAAADLNLKPGDTLLTDQESLFDLTKNLPLRLHVVGVLAPTGTPDDTAVFCDLKTDWIVAGLGHGHDDVAKVDPAQLLKKDAANLTASAAVRSFVEVTPENLASFHFHGEFKDFPLTAVIVANATPKAQTILKSRWNDPGRHTQALDARQVVDELLEMVFKAERFFDLGLLVVACACLLVLALVFNLSLRLRAAERDTLFRIGASKGTVGLLLVIELALVVAAGLAVAAVIAAAAAQLAPWVVGRVL